MTSQHRVQQLSLMLTCLSKARRRCLGSEREGVFFPAFARCDWRRWQPFGAHLGRMIFSLGWSDAKSLKVLNLTGGGWRKGLAPKLNSHCWYDMKLAAAKKPDLKGQERGGSG